MYNVEVGMNTILTCSFHSYLLPTFLVLKFFKFCIQFINIQWKHGGFHNESLKIILMLKNYHIKNLDLGGYIFWSNLPCLDLTTITSCFIGD